MKIFSILGVWESVKIDLFKPAGSASHGATIWRDSLYIVSGEGYGRSQLMYTYDFNGKYLHILILNLIKHFYNC